VIDMFCYRRYGHNEGDEPAFTQPLMYKKIRSHPTTLEIYSKKLDRTGCRHAGRGRQGESRLARAPRCGIRSGSGYKPNKADWLDGRWAGFKPAGATEDPRRGNTGVSLERLRRIGSQITSVPEGFRVHRTIQRFLENRRKAIESGNDIDWATAEALAFCTILQEGSRVRLSGRIPNAAPSRSAIRCCSIRRMKAATRRSTISATSRRITR
jgi:2-oxoglutarate dehydrogenase E1 component